MLDSDPFVVLLTFHFSEINGTGFQSAASSTQYPEIFGNVISKASTDADGLSIDGTVDASLQPKYSYPIAREKRLDSKLSSMLYESNKLSKSKPLNETPIEEAHPFDAFGETTLPCCYGHLILFVGEAYYRNEAESSVSSTESRALDLSIEGRNFIESDRIDEYNDFDKVDETVWQGKSLDRYTDRNAESDDDGNFDVQFSTSGKYVVRPSTKARYIDEASDDGGECQSISSTKECDEDTKSLLYLETGNISTVETGDATKDDNDMSKISLSCWPRALLASSISVEDSFAMIQNYYS